MLTGGRIGDPSSPSSRGAHPAPTTLHCMTSRTESNQSYFSVYDTSPLRTGAVSVCSQLPCTLPGSLLHVAWLLCGCLQSANMVSCIKLILLFTFLHFLHSTLMVSICVSFVASTSRIQRTMLSIQQARLLPATPFSDARLAGP